MQSTSNKVDSVQNKELLWSTLQESGAFAGVPGDQFQRVYAAFDRSVQEASRSMTGSLSDVNKHVIREFVQMLRTSTQQPQNPMQNITTQNQNQNPNQKKKKIEVVYRAEDLQNERASEFDRQFREKQAEMDSFLTLKKPTDVSFKDSELKEDKPIGDEMSRLIANELAARERELVQLKPEDIKRAQQWIGTTDNNGNNNATNNNAIKPELPLTTNFAKKSVSFSNTTMTNVVEEEHEMEQFEPEHNEYKPNEFINGENFEETDSIFSKFKKISEPLSDIGLPEPNASITIQQLYNKLLELEERMNAKHDEIMACLNVSASVMQNQFNQ
jgi:hypothetical protein